MRYMTTGKKILSSLRKCKQPVTLRRISGWHYNISFGSIYQTIHRLKKAGLITKVNGDKFTITDAGIRKLQEQTNTKPSF